MTPATIETVEQLDEHRRAAIKAVYEADPLNCDYIDLVRAIREADSRAGLHVMPSELTPRMRNMMLGSGVLVNHDLDAAYRFAVMASPFASAAQGEGGG